MRILYFYSMHAVLSKWYKSFKHNIQSYSGYKKFIKKYEYEKVVDLAEPQLDSSAYKQLPVFLRHLGVWIG